MNFFRNNAPPRIPPPKDQLLLHDGITMSVQTKYRFPEQLIRLLVTLMGSLGTLFCMYGFFDFPITLKPLVLLTVGLTVLIRVVRRFAPKLGFGGILLSFATIPLLLLRYREAAVVGAGVIYNIMRKKILWQVYFPDETAHAGDWSEAQCVQFVFVLVMIALVALLEYSDVLIMHTQSSRSGFLIRFLVTFPFLECGLYFGLETYSTAVFMLIFFWVGTLAVARHAPSKKLTASQGYSASLQYSFLNETEHRFTTHETGTAVLVLTGVLLCAATLFSTKGYVRSEEMNRKRQELRQAYREFTIRDVTGVLQRLPGSMGINVISDELDLTQNSDLHFDGRTVLHISVGNALHPSDYYMRGIIRSEYTGRGWGIPNALYRRNQKLFLDLTAENRMPQTLFHSDHINELQTTGDSKYPVVRCTVSAVKREHVNYAPYQSVFDVGTKYRFDTEVELDDTKEYGFFIMNNAEPDWPKFSSTSAPSSDPVVSRYEQFVQENYLSVPDNEAMKHMLEDFAPYMPAKELPLSDRLYAIRDYIWERADYTMTPGAQPADRDFAEYFLSEGHKGFCAHYASAAVLLCRMSGIPARYCQGYIMTQSNFATSKGYQSYEIDIPDDQAHAWAEIYVNGYGWVPFEFTESVVESWHTVPETVVTEPVTTPPPPVTSAPQFTTPLQTQMTTTTTQDQSELPAVLTPEQIARIKKIICVIFITALLVVAYYLLHRWLTARRKQAIYGSDPNAAAHASYQFMEHLLRMQGIEQKKRTYDEFAAEAERSCALLPKGKIKAASAIVQEAAFSRNGISKENAQKIAETSEQLAEAMYKNAKPLKKLWLRWGRHIVR